MPITVQGCLSHHLDQGPAARAEAGMSWLPHLPRSTTRTPLSLDPARGPALSINKDPSSRTCWIYQSIQSGQSDNQTIRQSVIIINQPPILSALPGPVMARLDHSLLLLPIFDPLRSLPNLGG